MAITISPNTYAGEALQEIIAQSVLATKTVESNAITVHSNIDKRMVVPTAAKAITIQDSTALFNPVGGISLGERYLDPAPFMINEQYDYSTINNWWFAANQPRGRAGDFVPPANVESVIMKQIAELNVKFVNFSIWRGSARFAEFGGINKTGSNNTLGLINVINDAPDSRKVSFVTGESQLVVTGITNAAQAVVTVASTANLKTSNKVTFKGLLAGTSTGTDLSTLNNKTFVITVLNATTFRIALDTTGFKTFATDAGSVVKFINESNAIKLLTSVYDNLSENVEDDEDFYLYGGKNLAKAYSLAQAVVANGAGSYFIGRKELDFLGQRMFIDTAIGDNTIVASKAGNLHFGTALDSEWNNAEILPQDATGNKVVNVRLDYAFDTQITNPSDITILD